MKIYEKVQLFQAISQNKSIFQGKFSTNLIL